MRSLQEAGFQDAPDVREVFGASSHPLLQGRILEFNFVYTRFDRYKVSLLNKKKIVLLLGKN